MFLRTQPLILSSAWTWRNTVVTDAWSIFSYVGPIRPHTYTKRWNPFIFCLPCQQRSWFNKKKNPTLSSLYFSSWDTTIHLGTNQTRSSKRGNIICGFFSRSVVISVFLSLSWQHEFGFLFLPRPPLPRLWFNFAAIKLSCRIWIRFLMGVFFFQCWWRGTVDLPQQNILR